MTNEEIDSLLAEKFELAEKGAKIIERLRAKQNLTVEDLFIILLKEEPECADIALGSLAQYTESFRNDISKAEKSICLLSDIEDIAADARARRGDVDCVVTILPGEMELVKKYLLTSRYGNFILCTLNFPPSRTGLEFLGYKEITLKDIVTKCILRLRSDNGQREQVYL